MKLAHLPGRIFTALATLGPLGTRMPAPGTWGSFAGLLLYAVGLRYFNDAAHWPTFLAVAVVLVIVSVAVCTIAEKHLNKKDPGEIILDEVVAMPLVYIGAEGFIRDASQPWAWVIVGFVLFRIFDVAKPFGIK
ncbi:MAG: phosphatidylglycerophosphatase A, partial [Puniceicoccales bacterium]|nr:phosphatidylglycerophosphatase A [Puniceicoccales bacterium]